MQHGHDYLDHKNGKTQHRHNITKSVKRSIDMIRYIEHHKTIKRSTDITPQKW